MFFQVRKMTRFSNMPLKIFYKNWSSITMFNAKWLTNINLCCLAQRWSLIEEKFCCLNGTTTVLFFWDFKPLSDTQRKMILPTATMSAWKSSQKHSWNDNVTSIKNYTGKEFDFDWPVLFHPPYSQTLASSDFHFFYSQQKALNDKNCFSIRLGENVCGKLVELKTSWILFKRNQ